MYALFLKCALSVGIIIAGLTTARAAEVGRMEPVDQIMRTYRARHVLPDLEEALTMTLVERPSGKKETTQRELTRYSTVTDDGARRVLLRFLEPPDVAGHALLTVETSQDTGQWTFVPKTHAVTAIAPTDRTRPFLGTAFTYEDLEPENLSRYRYTVTASETFHGFYHWAIAAEPVPEYVPRTAYSKRLVWIRQKDYALVRIHYYSKDGTLVKIRRYLDLEPVGDQAILARTDQMRDIQGRRKTVMTVNTRVLNAGLDETLFTPAGLGADQAVAR